MSEKVKIELEMDGLNHLSMQEALSCYMIELRNIQNDLPDERKHEIDEECLSILDLKKTEY